MKFIVYILVLFFLIPLNGLSQSDITIASTEQSTFKNKITFDFELLIAGSLSYKRKVSNKFSFGMVVGIGFPIKYVWFKKSDTKFGTSSFTESLETESFKIGPTLSYQINNKLYYELSFQYVGFLGGDIEYGGVEFNPLGLGIKNGIFYRWKKLEVGINVFTGKVENQYGERSSITYNSFFIVKIPIKQW
jgi:hypothetical protein